MPKHKSAVPAGAAPAVDNTAVPATETNVPDPNKETAPQKEIEGLSAPPEVVELTDRDSLYAKYAEMQKAGTGAPPEEGDAEKNASNSMDLSKDGEGEPSETEKDKALAKDERSVPYGSLKEEREKRKAIKAELDIAQGEIHKLQSDNIKLMEAYAQLENRLKTIEQGGSRDASQDTGDDLVIDDYDKALRDLMKQNKMLLQKIQAMEQGVEKTKVEATEHQIETAARAVDAQLAEEGYPGFYDHAEQVGKVLAAEFNKTGDKSLFTPAGWMKAYKEVVFPKVLEPYIKAQRKADAKDEKLKKKEDASLIGSPGKGTATPETKKGDPNSDYMKMRQNFAAILR